MRADPKTVSVADSIDPAKEDGTIRPGKTDRILAVWSGGQDVGIQTVQRCVQEQEIPS